MRHIFRLTGNDLKEAVEEYVRNHSDSNKVIGIEVFQYDLKNPLDQEQVKDLIIEVEVE